MRDLPLERARRDKVDDVRGALRHVGFWATLLFVSSSGAQPATDPGEAAYQEGRRLYDLHEWDQAIVKFKEAYKLRGDRAALYNIAQAYRLKGDCTEALSYYRSYRRNFPDAPNLEAVDKFIADLEPCAAAQATARATEPTGDATTPSGPATAGPPPESPEPPTPGRPKKIAGVAVAGAGLAMIATGVYFGRRAHRKGIEVEGGSGTWDPAIEDSALRDQNISTVLWVSGIAAVAGGGVLYWLGHRDANVAAVAVAPHHDGATLVWSCRY